MLVKLQPQEVAQAALDFDGTTGTGGIAGTRTSGDRVKLMTAFDSVNERFGRGASLLAGAGLPNRQLAWSMRQARRKPGYTTSSAEMPVARA